MLKKFITFLRKRLLLVVFLGFIVGIFASFCFDKTMDYTSTDKFCESCHVHPHVFDSWKLSTHYDNKSGMQVQCVDCHLPPKGEGYMKEKTRLGLKDLYGYLFKDSADFNWEARRSIEMASHYTFQASCLKCHPNLFPKDLSDDGMDAHLYYSMNEDKLNCLNCHIDVGHYDPNRIHAANLTFGSSTDTNKEIYAEAAVVEAHENFMETIPNTTVSFNMIAIPGGSFQIGSPVGESLRDTDESPSKTINVSSFFMAEVEVTWNEYLAFYAATASEGRSSDTKSMETETGADDDVDGISGPTPPYGQPDQNWGMGSRPAITMSFHAAETYCRWLSQVTGKNYRLPTEAEWEYAARGGTQTPYFFDGDPKEFAKKKKKNKEIEKYIIYQDNSQMKTHTPDAVEVNPFGLKNMLGNAVEYVSDWYAPDAYSKLSDGATNPKGPESGEEHVVRGGYFKSGAGDVRSASRDYTHTADWLKTDPQMPKSIWWLSDCNYISFRVVCEFDEKTGNN